MKKSLIKLRYLLEGSNNSNNSGYIPNIPKYEKTYLEGATCDMSVTTDLAERIQARDMNLNHFFSKYVPLQFDKKTATILCAIVDQSHYLKITDFISNVKRFLKRRKIDVLGYIWQRDVGDFKFEKHYHLLIATSIINPEVIMQIELWGNRCPDKSRIQVLRTKSGMCKYLKKKEIYAARYQKGFTKSQFFKSP
jgi:hypothetical protein